MATTPGRLSEKDVQAGVVDKEGTGKETAETKSADTSLVDDPEGDEKVDWRTFLRRGVAVVISFGAVATFLGSIWIPSLRVCKETAGGTSFTNTTSCNPWGLTELLPLLLLAAIFVLPDFSELSIVNLVTFKRELNAQKQELDATAARQTALESQVIGQLAQLNSVQNVNVHYVDPARLEEAIQEKSGASQGRTRHTEGETSAYDGARAVAAMDLLAEWELLAERLGLGRPRDRSMLDDEVARFRSIFRDEIDTVRRVRNSVAHNIYVDDSVLQNALNGARELNSILSRMA